MHKGIMILLVGGATMALVACGDDTGGGGGAGGAGTGGATSASTGAGDATTAATTGSQGTGGEGTGGEGTGGAPCEEVEDCKGCNSMNMGGFPGDLCLCNGPPASADIFGALVECTCSLCSDECADNACAGMFPSEDCQACITASCDDEDQACLTDE